MLNKGLSIGDSFAEPAFYSTRFACEERIKSSQKSIRPRGAKDVDTFPGAIGRNDACVRADAQVIKLVRRECVS